ncbi:MAG: hypothetical protein AAF663_01170 [Planctomycetota bacterium]
MPEAASKPQRDTAAVRAALMSGGRAPDSVLDELRESDSASTGNAAKKPKAVSKRTGRPSSRLPSGHDKSEIERLLARPLQVQIQRSKTTEKQLGVRIDELLIKQLNSVVFQNQQEDGPFKRAKDVVEFALTEFFIAYDRGEIPHEGQANRAA